MKDGRHGRREQTAHGIRIEKITLVQGEAPTRAGALEETRFASGEVVDANDLSTFGKKTIDQRTPMKPAAPVTTYFAMQGSIHGGQSRCHIFTPSGGGRRGGDHDRI